MSQKWFHAIGACGKTTANVCVMFKKMGWFVTGTDTQYLSPAKDILEDNGIAFELGYHYSHLLKEFWEEKLGHKLDIPDHPDLGLVVETATLKNKELLFAKKHGLDFRPYAQILRDYLAKPESLVVVGSSGKTTTTALNAFLQIKAGLNPSYMFGGESRNLDSSLENTDSRFSVIEGDEFYSKELSEGAKFLQYKPKYVIITKVSWEHVDVYETEIEYINEFKKLIKILPEDGLIIYKSCDKNIQEVLEGASVRTIGYGYLEQQFSADGTIQDASRKSQEADISYYITKGTERGTYKILDSKFSLLVEGNTSLLGEYNLENILSSFILFKEYFERGFISEEIFKQFTNYVSEFSGVKKRLEVLFSNDNLIIVDDFGVAPERAANSLRTLREIYPDFHILAAFEPNMGSRPKDENTFRNIYRDSFNDADEIIIPNLSENEELVSTAQFIDYMNILNFKVKNVPAELMINFLKARIQTHDKLLIVFFSPYRLTEVAQELIKSL